MEEKLTDQEVARREKLEKYVELGVDPFGERYEVKDQIRDIRAKYGSFSEEDFQKKEINVGVAGRLMAIRRMGKASFANIKDEYGNIQAWLGLNVIGEHDYEVFKLADLGDIVGISGTLMLTKTGELTIRATKFTHITKCLKPLPEKFHGLTDLEERCRKRYLDLIMNDDSRRMALLRPAIVKGIRDYCASLGFVEVETPVLSALPSGASARPFITHHNAFDCDFYLRIATELNLKKCLIGGIDRVFEIGRIFRNEGIDNKHNPEFTTIELYQAYADLSDMKAWAEGVFHYIADKVVGKSLFHWNGYDIDLSKPFESISMAEAIKRETGVDFNRDISFEEAVKLAKEHNVPLDPSWNSTGYIMQAFFDEKVEEKLIQPTFIHTYPIEVSPLTKKTKDPRFVDRFEIFIAGVEFANAYSELNNPFDQKERFEAQEAARDRGDEEASDIDFSFLEAQEYGMPPAGGIGLGIDRFCMFMGEEDTVREVILFPTLKASKNLSHQDMQKGNVENKVEVNNEQEIKKIDFSNVEIEPLFKDFVDFETFSKSDFRAVKVLACEAVAKSKKLLKFTLDDGSKTNRTILSGIHAYYEPEALVGKTCIAIANLPPRTMMGIDSCGMLISAVYSEEGEERLHLLMVDDSIPAGAKLY